MANHATRRAFLRNAPLAVLTPAALAQADAPATEPYKLITAKQVEGLSDKLDDTPGNETLFEARSLPFTFVLTTEQKKAAREFEWHEGRDHIVQVMDGETIYEVGGKPVGAHSAKAGEWNAPAATGAVTYTLREGDILIIPRNTLHKRTTKDSVTFTLTSTTGRT